MPTRIASPPRTLLLTAVAALALAVSGCGQEDDPAALLQTAFNTQVDSATVTVNARANLRGPSPQAAQPYGLRLSGPYKRNAENQLPSIDFQVAASQGPGALNARLVTVPDNAFAVFQGTPYEVGRQRVQQALQQGQRRQRVTLAELGVKPSTWVIDPQTRGETEVAGEDTTQVSGRLDLARMLRDVNRAQQEQARRGLSAGPPQEITEPQIAEVVRAVQQPTMDVFVAGDDTIRRLVVNAPFTVPPAQRQSGIEGGTVNVTTELADVGGDQRVTAPPNPRPIEELLAQFGLGAAPPGAGGGGAPGGP
ncbi:MAG: hypothetical protein ACR2LY_02055 [Thermoleophilaceae bacterium]